MMFHPQIIGNLALLDRLLNHMVKHPDVWFATGAEVARHWRKDR